jgi:tRNA 2-thiocytidine biosynthesis protein TtcA
MNPEAEKQAYYLLKRINQANRVYGLIEDRDRIGVAVSGGKDSLSLLKLLQLYLKRSRAKYELVALHVQVADDPNERERSEKLSRVFEDWGVPYRILSMDLNPGEPRPLPCHRCTWYRRKALFLAAESEGLNKIAFGHHQDDRAETALLGLLFAGTLEDMPPRRDFFGGKFAVIRPLILASEKEIRRFSLAAEFPDLGYHCPQAQLSKRATVRRLLEIARRENRNVVANVINAVEKCNMLRQK